MQDFTETLFDSQGEFLGTAQQWANLQRDIDALATLRKPTPEELALCGGLESLWRECGGDVAAILQVREELEALREEEDAENIAAMEADLEFISRQPWIPLGDFERCGSQFGEETFEEARS